ncbi:MAG: hypothetical protein K0Q94_3281, partial [Paenibacillus sp.]|nr:hypothetical protein [Paenibacillus sp.]
MRLTGKGKVTKYGVTLLLMVSLLISIGFPDGILQIETAYGQTGPSLHIVQNGQAQAAIILPANADARLRASADTLAAYVQKSTGAVLPVWDEDEVPAGSGQLQDLVWIHVGASGLYP